MSLFSSILTAGRELEHLGFEKLGHSLGGTSDRTFWFDSRDGIVAEGHILFGDNRERYQISLDAAPESLYQALYSIRRSEHPEWTADHCRDNALTWAKLLGFVPEFSHAA